MSNERRQYKLRDNLQAQLDRVKARLNDAANTTSENIEEKKEEFPSAGYISVDQGDSCLIHAR